MRKYLKTGSLIVVLGMLSWLSYQTVKTQVVIDNLKTEQARAFDSKTQILNMVHNPATHTLQVESVTRGIATPGTGNMSETQILNDVYSAGNLQVSIDSNSSDIPFINYTTEPPYGAILVYDPAESAWVAVTPLVEIVYTPTPTATPTETPTPEPTATPT